MAGKTPRLYLEHIQESIALIEGRVAGKTFQDFVADDGLRDGIARNLERVSDARATSLRTSRRGTRASAGGRSPGSATSCVTTIRASTTARVADRDRRPRTPKAAVATILHDLEAEGGEPRAQP